LSFVCFFAFILFFQAKSQKKIIIIKAKQKQKNKSKKQKINNKNANGQVHFSHFFTLFDVPLFSHLLCFLFFFGFEVFFLFCMCFAFFFNFSSLKNIRTSGRGEHKVWVLQESVHDNFKKNENNNNIKKQL
jgi:Mg2+/citrate symporter